MGNFYGGVKFRKRNRRKDVISVEDVEESRIRFGLNKTEFAELMGIRVNQYIRCEKKGGFLAFRYYAALDAIELNIMRKSQESLKKLTEMRTGVKITELNQE